MEHRYYPRVPVDNWLLIYVGKSVCVSGAIKNISNGGFAVDTVDSAHLKRNALVELAVEVNGSLEIFPSQVTRTSENGAALMFTDDGSPPKQVLKDWLSGAVPTYISARTG